MTAVNPAEPAAKLYADDFATALREGLVLDTFKARVAVDLEALLGESRFVNSGRLLFAGSGDSLFASRSTLPALRRWTGVSAEVMTALEFARYEVPLLGPDDVLVGVSNSGSSARSREAIALAKDRGNLTVGIIGMSNGPLAQMAHHVVHRPVNRIDGLDPDYATAFLHCAEYVAALYTLFALGLELGVRRGRVSVERKAQWYAEIDAAIGAIHRVALATEQTALGLAAALREADTIWIIGAGPNRGTADYCAAKFHEQIPLNGVARDLEEWAHLEYFLTLSWRGRSVVLVLAPPGNGLDRAEELVGGIAEAGGRVIVLAHPGHGDFEGAAERFDLAVDLPELLTPIIYHVPVQLLVLHLARLIGVAHIPLERADDYRLTRKGFVRESARGLS